MTLAPQIQYRDEYIAGYEQRITYLRQSVTTEAMVKGNQAVFLVADSNSAEAKTRGRDGLIQARTDNLVQNTATLVEKHDLVRRSGFDIMTSQGDGRRIMQENSIGVINRDIDQVILTELDQATQTWGDAQVATLEAILKAKVKLGNNEVPMDGNITAVISAAFHAYLMQMTEFASADYVSARPFTSDMEMFRWNSVNWIVHPNVSGKGTAAEKCFMYHKSAIGHALGMNELQVEIGRDAEQDYSFARTSFHHGPKILQNAGIVEMTHDGSAYA